MSLIKGGHTSYKIRLADHPVRYQGDTLDVLIAFDQLSIQENEQELVDGSILIHDAKFEPSFTINRRLQVIKVPMSETAKRLGNVIMKNIHQESDEGDYQGHEVDHGQYKKPLVVI